MTQDQIDDQLKGLLATSARKFFVHTFESVADGKNNRSFSYALFFFLVMVVVLIIYAGIEPIKIFMRKNFGSEGINQSRLVLSSIAFFAVCGFSYVVYADHAQTYAQYGTQESFLRTSQLYFLFGVYLPFKGFREVNRKNDTHDANYRGDSKLLGFMTQAESGGWTQASVQLYLEPLVFLVVGFFLIGYNMFMGLPLMICALSYWLYSGLEYIVGLGNRLKELTNKGHAYSKDRPFSKAN